MYLYIKPWVANTWRYDNKRNVPERRHHHISYPNIHDHHYHRRVLYQLYQTWWGVNTKSKRWKLLTYCLYAAKPFSHFVFPRTIFIFLSCQDQFQSTTQGMIKNELVCMCVYSDRYELRYEWCLQRWMYEYDLRVGINMILFFSHCTRLWLPPLLTLPSLRHHYRWIHTTSALVNWLMKKKKVEKV